MESDESLLRRFAEGDSQAMDRLVSRHGPTVYAFLGRILGRSSLADDLYQEVWIKVIRKADGFQGKSRFSTWLFQVVRNTCIDHLREIERKPSPVSLDGGHGDADEVA